MEAFPSANLSAISTARLYRSFLSRSHCCRPRAAIKSSNFRSLTRLRQDSIISQGEVLLSHPCSSTMTVLFPLIDSSLRVSRSLELPPAIPLSPPHSYLL